MHLDNYCMIFEAMSIIQQYLLHFAHNRTESVSIMLDVRLPGKVTEFHEMGKLGTYLIV